VFRCGAINSPPIIPFVARGRVAAWLGLAAGPAAAAGAPGRHGVSGPASIRLEVTGGNGLLLTRSGATARLSVGAVTGGTPVTAPGTLRFASSAPAVVSVNGDRGSGVGGDHDLVDSGGGVPQP
jgi:hypothetical protein